MKEFVDQARIYVRPLQADIIESLNPSVEENAEVPTVSKISLATEVLCVSVDGGGGREVAIV